MSFMKQYETQTYALLRIIHFSKMSGGWPINNKGDAAVLFCFIFLYIAAKGSGTWSVDEKRS